MRNPVMERATLSVRHDFDALPSSVEIIVRPAAHSELSVLADMANRLVPGVQITEADLERYFAFDPESILTFSRGAKLLGAVAFLYLNRRGRAALVFNKINLAHPEFELLADRSDEVSAIYVRAIAGQGRAMAGLGNVSRYLSRPRLAPADLYAQPSSADGRNLTIAIGFEQIPSHQHELWRYQRPWNRIPETTPASIISAGSFADARH
jgi:hypothetical protein